MIGIDTNILVRYLTQDDDIQSDKVAELLNQHSGKSGSVFINNIVMCELVWVLERGYKYSKIQIIEALKAILSTSEFVFEDHQLLWLAINEYSNSKADFSDIIIGRQNILNGCKSTITLDKGAATLEYFSMLE